MNEQAPSIVILVLDEMSTKALTHISPQLISRFERDVHVIKRLHKPKYAFNPQRQQYHSTSMIKRLSEHHTKEPCSAVVGVTNLDLFIPEEEYVFGEADRTLKTGVLSIRRLDPEFHRVAANDPSFISRISVEILHVIGKIFGLAVCTNNRCPMYQSLDIMDVDRKIEEFCAICKKRLEQSMRELREI